MFHKCRINLEHVGSGQYVPVSIRYVHDTYELCVVGHKNYDSEFSHSQYDAVHYTLSR